MKFIENSYKYATDIIIHINNSISAPQGDKFLDPQGKETLVYPKGDCSYYVHPHDDVLPTRE